MPDTIVASRSRLSDALKEEGNGRRVRGASPFLGRWPQTRRDLSDGNVTSIEHISTLMQALDRRIDVSPPYEIIDDGVDIQFLLIPEAYP